MEPIFIMSLLLVGTVAGYLVAVILAQLSNRKPAAEAASLRVQLQTTEASLAAATAGNESLRKQAAEREQLLKKQQEALDATQNGTAREATAVGDDPVRELKARAEGLIALCAMVESRTKEAAERAAEDAAREKSAMEAQLEAEQRRAAELAEQLTRAAEEAGANQALQDQLLTAGARLEASSAEMAELKQAVETARGQRAEADTRASQVEAQRAALEAQLATERDHSRGLAEMLDRLRSESGSAITERDEIENQLAAARGQANELAERLASQKAELDAATADAVALEQELASERAHGDDLKAQLGAKTVEAADFRQSTEQNTEVRTELEKRLAQEQERNQELLKQVTDLRTEIVQLEGRLEEERRTAANGMKLLSAAQDNLARVFKALAMDPPAIGSNGHASPEPPAPAPAAPVRNTEEKQPVLA